MRLASCLAAAVVAAAAVAGDHEHPAPTKTHPAFERLKSLAGTWTGKAISAGEPGSDASVVFKVVVRKIIEIIRAQEPADFIWVSRRTNRMIPLSARLADNAALEDFLMREFFSGEPR